MATVRSGPSCRRQTTSSRGPGRPWQRPGWRLVPVQLVAGPERAGPGRRRISRPARRPQIRNLAPESRLRLSPARIPAVRWNLGRVGLAQVGLGRVSLGRVSLGRVGRRRREPAAASGGMTRRP
jgi:hypothetical protein